MSSDKPFLIYGIHTVLAALENPARHSKKLYLSLKTQKSLNEKLKKLKLPPLKIIENRDFDALLGVDAVHQGIALEVFPLRSVSLDEVCRAAGDQGTVVILDQVTDPHNVGAILRSCAAFGALALLVTEHYSPQITGVLAKAASGALEHVPIIEVANLSRALSFLKEQRFWCYGLDEEGEVVLGQTPFTGRVAFIFGAEGQGLRRLTRESCDALVRLPTNPNFPTLNVSTTASIVLYEASQSCAQKNS